MTVADDRLLKKKKQKENINSDSITVLALC